MSKRPSTGVFDDLTVLEKTMRIASMVDTGPDPFIAALLASTLITGTKKKESKKEVSPLTATIQSGSSWFYYYNRHGVQIEAGKKLVPIHSEAYPVKVFRTALDARGRMDLVAIIHGSNRIETF